MFRIFVISLHMVFLLLNIICFQVIGNFGLFSRTWLCQKWFCNKNWVHYWCQFLPTLDLKLYSFCRISSMRLTITVNMICLAKKYAIWRNSSEFLVLLKYNHRMNEEFLAYFIFRSVFKTKKVSCEFILFKLLLCEQDTALYLWYGMNIVHLVQWLDVAFNTRLDVPKFSYCQRNYLTIFSGNASNYLQFTDERPTVKGNGSNWS